MAFGNSQARSGQAKLALVYKLTRLGFFFDFLRDFNLTRIMIFFKVK